MAKDWSQHASTIDATAPGVARNGSLLAALIVFPIVLGWILFEGLRAGMYGPGMAVALVTAVNILLMGAFAYTATRSVDRADRKRRDAEAIIRANEERMDFALDAGGVGVWDANPAAQTLTCSETLEAMHGLPRGGFNGTVAAFLASVHPEDLERAQSVIESDSEAHTSPRVEYRTIWPDGSIHWIVASGRRVGIGTRKEARVVGIGIDITERRQLENQLRQAQKMDAIGQLAGGVAHDFNNLLTVILGFAEMLAEERTMDDSSREGIDQIRQAAERATGLTRQLLAFSRRQILQPTVVDPNAVVTNAVHMLRRLIPESITLKIRLGPGLRNVRADVTQIEQVLMNLVVNARDAMANGGMVTLETANVVLDDVYLRRQGVTVPAAGAYVMIAVSDTGIGMDRETQKRVFEPFFTTKLAGAGTGLGLATVYGIVKQSNGFVWVESELGKGATFKTYLPAMDTLPIEADEMLAVPEASPRGVETVLLVEDEDSVRLLARTLLERCGYRVLEASAPSIAEAVCAEEKSFIHLLVSDVVMPGSNGPALFSRLRGLRPAMKVLYMSGYADGAVIDRGVLAPGAPFIQKPFSALSLTRKVREVLDS